MEPEFVERIARNAQQRPDPRAMAAALRMSASVQASQHIHPRFAERLRERLDPQQESEHVDQ